MYFSVFVYMIPKQTFIQCKSFWTDFHIENRKLCSLGQVVHACAIENHMSENAIFEPVDFIMWMLYAVLSGTKLIPEWKSIPE